MATRGVIVTCRMHAGPGLEISAMPLEDLRRYTLYWDTIVGARPRIHGNLSPGWAGFGRPDFEFLASTDIFQEIDVDLDDVPNLKTNDVLPLAQMRLANTLMNEGKMLWSVAQVTDNIILPTQERNSVELFEIELYNSLPVPAASTPLDRILNFKEKRKPELLQLRSALDSLYEKVTTATDKTRARVSAIEKLDLALSYIDRSLRESRIDRFLTNLKMYLNLRESPVIGAVLGAIGASQLGVPVTMGALAGVGVNAAIAFYTRRFQDKVSLPPSAQDFVYVYRASKALHFRHEASSVSAPVTKKKQPALPVVHNFPSRLNETACPACGIPYSYTTFAQQIKSAFPSPNQGEVLKINCSECNHVASWLYNGEWDRESEIDVLESVLGQLDPRYLSARAEHGDASAQCKLAIYFECSGDQKNAAMWYRRAAEQGHAHAQFNLAVLLQNGFGVTQDSKQAVEWYEKASIQDYVNAKYNLAFMREHGYGCAKDLQAALQLYRDAARENETDSQCKLALLMLDAELQSKANVRYREDGWDFVAKNHEEAKRLLFEASTYGHTLATHILELLGWK